MSEFVTIKSASSLNTLTLSEPENLKRPSGAEYFRATLTGDSLNASAKIYAYQPHGHIATLFDTLAADWNGWEGEKQWASLEGELTLKCTWLQTGQVKMEVTMSSGPYSDDWTVSLRLILEPNQLDKIASDMREFFL